MKHAQITPDDSHKKLSERAVDPHKSSQVSSTIFPSQLRTRQSPALVQRNQFNPVLLAKYGMDTTTTNTGKDVENRGRQQRNWMEREFALCKPDAARYSPDLCVV